MKRQYSPDKVDDEQPAQRRKTHPRASSPGLSGSDGEDDEFENEPDDNVSNILDNVNNLILTQAIRMLKFTTALKNCFLTSGRGVRSNTSCSMGGILSTRTWMSHLKIELK
jgi:hypothetical protein